MSLSDSYQRFRVNQAKVLLDDVVSSLGPTEMARVTFVRQEAQQNGPPIITPLAGAHVVVGTTLEQSEGVTLDETGSVLVPVGVPQMYAVGIGVQGVVPPIETADDVQVVVQTSV